MALSVQMRLCQRTLLNGVSTTGGKDQYWMRTDNVLTAYGLPPFEDILNSNFRKRYGLNQAGQYGVACRDVVAECHKAEVLGSGPFFVNRIPAPNWVENGERRRCKLEFALGYIGEDQLEFLGPGKGTGFYADALQGSEHVLHHVGVFQNNSNELEQKLNGEGFKTVIDGGVNLGNIFGFKFKYIDTRDEIGCYLELLDFYLFDLPISIKQPVKLLAGLRKKIVG
jgi:hypothetical protein